MSHNVKFGCVADLIMVVGCQSPSRLNTAASKEVHATVVEYVRAARASDEAAVRQVSEPDSSVATQWDEMSQVSGEVGPKRVFIREDLSLVVSGAVRGDHDRTGFLVYELRRRADGKWRIRDIDLKDSFGVEADIDRFARHR